MINTNSIIKFLLCFKFKIKYFYKGKQLNLTNSNNKICYHDYFLLARFQYINLFLSNSGWLTTLINIY